MCYIDLYVCLYVTGIVVKDHSTVKITVNENTI